MAERPFAWEKSYPPGIHWDVAADPRTLPELIADAVAAHAGRPALDYRGTTITYDALGRDIARIANALRRDGLGRGDTVALHLPNCPYHPAFFFGVLTAGARVTHLSPLEAVRELAFKCEDSGARLLVTINQPRFLQAAGRLLAEGRVGRVVVCDDFVFTETPGPRPATPEGFTELADFLADFSADSLAGEGDTAGRAPCEPGDVALLQYTGGTTGMPKGAMLTHANLMGALASYDAWFAGERRVECQVVMVVLPLFHIYALTTILLRKLKDGALLLLRPRFDAGQVLDEIERRGVTHVSGVPTMWIAIANTPGLEARDLSSLVACASGGAPLPVEIFRRFERLTGHRLRGGWGMTETSPAGTNLPYDTPASKEGTIGLPLPGIEIEIVSLEDPHRVLPAGEVGEMRIRGRNVTAGYWNRPEESAAAFADGYLLTGDVGRMDEDGYFFIVDRKKDMILSGGFNVYPLAIEQAIHEHPDVAEVAVIGVPDDYRGEAAKAFVVLRAGAPAFTLDALKAFLADRLGRHEMPQYLEFRDALPRTPVGKLSRGALREAEGAPAAPPDQG